MSEHLIKRDEQIMVTQSQTDKRLYYFMIVMLILALGVSGYLSYLKMFPSTEAACIAGGAFDCNTVLNSRFSEVMDIPIAYLGFVTNIIMLVGLIVEKKVPNLSAISPLLVFFVALFAFIFSVYLVYVQAAIIGAYCPWCLTHELLIALIFGAAGWRLKLSWATAEE
jgi:uncharacterized membrane protein